MEEKVLEKTINEGAVVETTNEMPVEVPTETGMPTPVKVVLIGVAATAATFGLFLLGKKVYNGIKAKKAEKNTVAEVVESSENEK
jgi:hypothetical protein